MHAAEQDPANGSDLRHRIIAAAGAPAALWQVAAIALAVVLVVIAAAAAVGSRVSSLNAKLDQIIAADGELDKKLQKLDGKVEGLRASVSQLQQAKPATQTPAAPGQIPQKKKP